MQITIIDNNRAQSFLEQNAFIWKRYEKRHLYAILFCFIIGVIFSVVGFNSYNEYGKMENFKNVTYINIHLMESVGILFLLFSGIHIFRFFKMKKQFFDKIKLITDRYTQKDANVIYINLTDASVSYQSHFSKIEFVWEAVTGYHINGNLIFLYTSDAIESAIIIDKRLLSAADFSELSVFIHSRVKLKTS
jgi:hypothetical protein